MHDCDKHAFSLQNRAHKTTQAIEAKQVQAHNISFLLYHYYKVNINLKLAFSALLASMLHSVHGADIWGCYNHDVGENM